jgi:FkbM family methyltransferase
LTAVALDRVGEAGRVIALEAAPQHFDELAWLARLNPRHRVELHHAAAAELDGSLELFLNSHRGWHSTVKDFNSVFGQQTGSVQVKALCLDSVAREAKLLAPGAIRLIKVDVEGAELSVVRGASELLAARAADAWLIETSQPGQGRPVADPSELFARMQAAGYRAYRPETFPERPTTIAAADISDQADVLFVLERS